MRRLLTVLSTLTLVVLLAACGGDENTQNNQKAASSPPNLGARGGQVQSVEPEPVPDLTLETLDGESIELDEQDGKVLLINFWATWCAPCRKEIPDLNALYSDLKQEGLTVIGIALDRKGAEVVRPFVENQTIDYPIVVDKEGLTEAELGPIHGLPTTVVVDPKGRITKRVIGIFPVDKMKPTLQDMLAATGSASGTT